MVRKDGPWVKFNENGQLAEKGTYKDGKKDGFWVSYHDKGQLLSRGTYKDGKTDGPWVFFKKDGTKRLKPLVWRKMVLEGGSGTYKNGVKVK